VSAQLITVNSVSLVTAPNKTGPSPPDTGYLQQASFFPVYLRHPEDDFTFTNLSFPWKDQAGVFIHLTPFGMKAGRG
jgi:hypothetical protein